MFDLIGKLCQSGESINVIYKKTGDSEVTLVIKPELDDDPEKLTDDTAKQCRAMLTRPIVMRGTHSGVEQQFRDYVNQAGDARSELHDSYRTLAASMTQMTQKVTRAVSDKQAKSGSAPEAKDQGEADKGQAQPDTKADAKPAEQSASESGEQPKNLFG